MKDFALVNFIQGSMKKADGTFFKARLYGALVDASFAAFQVDSTDVDPVYWSTSSSRWNYTPVGKTGFLATDSPGPALSTEKGAEYKLDFRIELHELAKVPTTTTGSLSVSPLASALWDYKVKIDGSGKFSH